MASTEGKKTNIASPRPSAASNATEQNLPKVIFHWGLSSARRNRE
jgi:hypothetical protein